MTFIITPDQINRMVEIAQAKQKEVEEPTVFLSKENFFQAFMINNPEGDMFDLIVAMQKEIDIYNPLVVLGYEGVEDRFHWHVLKERGEWTPMHYHIKTKNKDSPTGKMYRRAEKQRNMPPKPKNKWRTY